MAADRDSKGNLHRHPNGADGARPKNGMQLCHEYSLMALEEPVGDTAAVGTQVRGDSHWATRGAANATSKDVAAAGAGGRHGAGRGESARGAGQQENPAGDSSGVVNKEGGHEASRVE